MSAKEAKLTFREAVEEFEDAVRDDEMKGSARPEEWQAIEMALEWTKKRLLALDPGDPEREAEDRYAEEHEFDVPTESGTVAYGEVTVAPKAFHLGESGVGVQPPGISPHSMVDYANRVLRGPVGEDGRPL